MKVRMKANNRPIWGFPAELSYLALFSLLVVLGAAFRIWYETDRRVTDDAGDTVVEIIVGIGQVGLAAATCTAGIAAISEVTMILAERYKARRYAQGLAEGRANAVERAIRLTAEEISHDVEVRIDTSQWSSREVMRVVVKRGARETEAFEVTIEEALSSRLHPLLKDRIESLA